MKKILAIVLALAMVLSMAACGGTKKEAAPVSTWPEAPVSFVVPYGAGGLTDLCARVVAEKMTETLGTPVEVTNVTGAAGTIGAAYVIDAGADGYTLGFGITTPLTITPLYGQTSYTIEDVQPICTVYDTTQAIAVAADSDIQTVDDLIAYIDANGGAVSYGGSGTGNLQHMTIMEWFSQVNPSWDNTIVPYTDGDAAEAVALMSHEVPFAIIQCSGAKSYVEDGSLRLLMVFNDVTPSWIEEDGLDIPLVGDLGYKFSLAGTIGIWGPAGIGEDVIAAVDKAFQDAVADAGVQQSIKNLGLEVAYRDVEGYSAIMDAQVPAAEALLKELGLI